MDEFHMHFLDYNILFFCETLDCYGIVGMFLDILSASLMSHAIKPELSRNSGKFALECCIS